MDADTHAHPEPDVFHSEDGTPLFDPGVLNQAVAWGAACWDAGVDPDEAARELGLA